MLAGLELGLDAHLYSPTHEEDVPTSGLRIGSPARASGNKLLAKVGFGHHHLPHFPQRPVPDRPNATASLYQ
jgi:hypothetical protein